MGISTITLVIALVAGLTGISSADQQSFNLDSNSNLRSSTGILRRFSNPDTLGIVLDAAQVLTYLPLNHPYRPMLALYRLLQY